MLLRSLSNRLLRATQQLTHANIDNALICFVNNSRQLYIKLVTVLNHTMHGQKSHNSNRNYEPNRTTIMNEISFAHAYDGWRKARNRHPTFSGATDRAHRKRHSTNY